MREINAGAWLSKLGDLKIEIVNMVMSHRDSEPKTALARFSSK
jgi:hypothetical protein